MPLPNAPSKLATILEKKELPSTINLNKSNQKNIKKIKHPVSKNLKDKRQKTTITKDLQTGIIKLKKIPKKTSEKKNSTCQK